MYVALRELRAAKWRFALITGVVFLLALLVTGLSGLTSGLGHQNISALQSLGDGRFAMAASDGAAPDLDRSALTRAQVDALTSADPAATPVGISRVRLDDGAGGSTSVVALGLDRTVGDLTPPPAGQLLLTPGAAREPGLGERSTIGSSAGPLTVAGTGDDLWHAHGAVVVTDLQTWHRLAPRGENATLVALGDGAATAPGVDVVDADGLLGALPSYQAENGSLTLMSTLLMAISALVVGAFFTVWSIQRQRDVAVLKALGASTRVLVVDALGQAVVVLVIGVGLGVGIAALGGLGIPDTVPYLVSPTTTVVPAAILVVLGLLGAALALRPVVGADPTTALGALR